MEKIYQEGPFRTLFFYFPGEAKKPNRRLFLERKMEIKKPAAASRTIVDPEGRS